jgi:uncharacterized protein YbaR (Trm112 family)
VPIVRDPGSPFDLIRHPSSPVDGSRSVWDQARAILHRRRINGPVFNLGTALIDQSTLLVAGTASSSRISSCEHTSHDDQVRPRMTLGRTRFGLTRSTSLVVLVLSPRPSVRRSTDPYAHTELRGLISPHTHPSAALNSFSAGPSSPSSSGTIYPTYVLPASITTIHPQLRDLLVCPKERGRLYYVQGKGITELRVDLEGEREYGEQVREGKAVVGEWAPKVSLDQCRGGALASAKEEASGRTRPTRTSSSRPTV